MSMNFLGHATLSGNQPLILAGNMMGDYFKGRAVLDTLPAGLRKGILLHREIDAFTDNHLAVRKAAQLFRPAYRQYAKAILDHIWDHFLANDPAFFPSETALKTFTVQVYAQVEQQAQHYFPEGFSSLFRRMQEENWMYAIRSQRGVKQSLERMRYSAKYLARDMEEAYRIFILHYYELNQLFFDFIEAADDFAKNRLKTDLDQ